MMHGLCFDGLNLVIGFPFNDSNFLLFYNLMKVGIFWIVTDAVMFWTL